MSDVAIKVENLSKLYRLGEIGTGTISHDLNRWWARMRGKEDPFAILGETNDRTSKGSGEYVWSLKDLNFEVKQGEVLGIIGRNGAGKSTLLKVLSKITAPTTGSVKVRGRIASLLEVGTGFHPELTGRENIFLNGAILGMTKVEIRGKFDEIVDFSGVERYIDTPVKRYSSGMYVRLAFAVAAFLEPEILIVDEVLAVGDAEFQKKCLGRMKDVSVNDGRTVLFVSHNMGAVKALCNEVLLLKHGGVIFQGDKSVGINSYIESTSSVGSSSYRRKADWGVGSHFNYIQVINDAGIERQQFGFDESVGLRFQVRVQDKHSSALLGFKVYDTMERCVFATEKAMSDFITQDELATITVQIPSSTLVPNAYKLQFGLHIPNMELIEVLPEVVQFEILETGSDFYQYADVDNGCVLVNCAWHASQPVLH